jgi:Tfp pilus assembly protein FimT
MEKGSTVSGKGKKMICNKRAFTFTEITIYSAIVATLILSAYKYSLHILSKKESEIFLYQLQHIIKFYKIKAMFSNQKIIVCGSTDQLHCSNNWTNGILVISKHKKLNFYPGTKYGKVTLSGFASYGHKIEILPTGFTHNNGHFSYLARNLSFKKYLYINKAVKSYIKD